MTIVVTQAPFSSFEPRGAVTSTTPQGWEFQDPEQFFKPKFPVFLQRFEDFAPKGTIVSTTPQGWWGQSPERFVKPFPAILQRVEDFSPQGVVVSFYKQSWVTQEPQRFVKPFPVSLQRFQDFTPRGAIISTTPQGGYSDLLPRFAKLFPAQLAQFEGFVPAGQVATPVIKEWIIDTLQILAKPNMAALAAFENFPLKITAAITPQGWQFRDPELFFKPAFHASRQRFADFAPRGAIVSTTPQGWWGQSPERFAKAFGAWLQQYTAEAILPIPVPVPKTLAFADIPTRFRLPSFNALLQLESMQMRGVIPPPPVPPILPRPTLGVVTVIDLNTGSTYGTAPAINEPFSLLINMNMSLLPSTVTLRFVSPYGATQFANFSYLYTGPQTVFVKEQLFPFTYIMYNTAPGEFSVSGVWQVFVESGPFSGGPYLFTVVPVSPIVV